ncbi:gamma-glutamyl-gamma-aminobutyrate hydrolase family protein [Chloroflexales bacterium ZM16-3]|nr:gamma-glutamyl-gamma-aminobutyrate hydrolase family protein [Chloroflexales bacterium ZM16-3]
MKRPIIGVSCMNNQDGGGSALMAVRPTYLGTIEVAGGTPLLIHLTDNIDVVRALYGLCDGILLPGGVDVDPAYYGEEPIPELGDIDRQRDEAEITLARWTREDNKPLMGICRGIQVLNVTFGGSLYQDVPSQLPETFDHGANTKTRQYDVLTHSIALEPDIWLAEHLSTDEVMSNTMHHQSVKQPTPGLRVVGRAFDGVIEALEGVGDQFMVAVQCHPEHLWASAETRWLRMFEGSVAACRS